MDKQMKALKFIVKQIKAIDDNVFLLEETGMRSSTQKIRLELFDILTSKGYEITMDYKLVKK
jgi:hypothetical protein